MTAIGKLLSLGVEADLHSRKYPVKVVYGPERLPRENYAGLVLLFARDRTTSDTFGAPAGQRANPRYIARRMMALELKIYAQSTEDQPTHDEHESLAEVLADAAFISIREWCVANKRGEPLWTQARFLSAEEKAKEEVPPGDIYMFRFQVARAVVKVDFDGAALPEGVVTRMRNQTQVSVVASQQNPVIGCNQLEEA